MALVRLKPYNPRRGNILRRFTSLRYGFRLRGDRGWYDITDNAKLEYLKTVCQNGNTIEENKLLHIDSKLAFDIAKDEEEAKEIERQATAVPGRTRRAEPGTIDAPVRVGRPGKKGTGRPGKKAPKTRQRKSANEKVADLSVDELVAKRSEEISVLAETSLADLRKDAKERGIKVPRGADAESVATLIVDHDPDDDE